MPRHCVFCNDRKLTREDIWPRWFKKWLRNQPQLESTFSVIRHVGDTTTVEKTQSPTVGGKRWIACKRCNNRLGRLQKDASAVLKPMLDHPYASPQVPIELPPTDQAILSAWAAMTAMTAEFLPWPMPDNDETFFSQEEGTPWVCVGSRKTRYRS